MDNTQQKVKILQMEIKTMAQRMHTALHLSNVETSVVLNNFIMSFQAQIVARMAGNKIQTYRHPKTWLDFFKQRWFPKFLLKIYPIEYITLHTWHCFPEYPIKDLGQPIQFFVLENESYDKITS